MIGVLALGACTAEVQGPASTTSSQDARHGLYSRAAPRQPPVPGDYSQYLSRPTRAESFSTTFGFALCALSPDAQIIDVRPSQTVGLGFDAVAVRLVTFHPDDGWTLASPGYPPKSREGERIEAAAGASPHQCSDRSYQSEIQVGMRKTSGEGGGWRGAVVDYSMAGEGLSLEIPFGMLMCGASTEPC